MTVVEASDVLRSLVEVPKTTSEREAGYRSVARIHRTLAPSLGAASRIADRERGSLLYERGIR